MHYSSTHWACSLDDGGDGQGRRRAVNRSCVPYSPLQGVFVVSLVLSIFGTELVSSLAYDMKQQTHRIQNTSIDSHITRN